MTKHTLYAYAIGGELELLALGIETRINEFIESRLWNCPDVWAVFQQNTEKEWEIGINLSIPNPDQETSDWYLDVEAIVAFCGQLRNDFGQDFIIGIVDNQSGCSEDIIAIDSKKPNYDYLYKFIGTQLP